jgi:hypothetical protein
VNFLAALDIEDSIVLPLLKIGYDLASYPTLTVLAVAHMRQKIGEVFRVRPALLDHLAVWVIHRTACHDP